MKLLPSQCRAARALKAMTQATLASKSGVSLRTIISFELGARQPKAATLHALRDALEAQGVKFIDGNEPGARLKAISDYVEDPIRLNPERPKSRAPKRAATRRAPKNEEAPWQAAMRRGERRALRKVHAAWKRLRASAASKPKE